MAKRFFDRWIPLEQTYFDAMKPQERCDFTLDAVERDVIERHMFPLNPVPPRYRESVLVCLADKICAIGETLHLPAPAALAQPLPGDTAAKPRKGGYESS